MKLVPLLFSILLPSLLVSGCYGREDTATQNVQQTLRRLTDAVEKNSFAFDGSTSLRGQNYYANGLVVFNGHVERDRDVYLRLITGERENGVMEEMDMFSSKDGMYMRFADEVEWKAINQPAALMNDEMNHWNPLAHFKRLNSLGKEIQLDRSKGSGRLHTIRVKLDSEKLKQEFLHNVKGRVNNDQFSSDHGNLSNLSAGIAGEDGVVTHLSELKDEMRKGLDELENSIEIEGEYVISYDREEGIPTNLVYRQEVRFSDGGVNQNETSELEMVLRDFGEDHSLTDRLGMD